MLSEHHKRKIGNARRGQKYGENSIRYYPICLWCGVEFCAKRPDAKTCSTACRVALARYVKKHGQPPMFPFGLKPDSKGARKKTEHTAATNPTKKGQR